MRSILVFTEGRCTEVSYVKAWHRKFRQDVTVTVSDEHGVPSTLVDLAAIAKRQEARAERRGKGPAHDEYWCMFDIDDHVKIPEALDKASANGINVAVSNPCVELWFLIHFRPQTAYLEREEAQKLSKDVTGCDKRLTEDANKQLVDKFLAAKGRAIELDKKHDGDGSPPRSNPSSNVHELIDRIRADPSHNDN